MKEHITLMRNRIEKVREELMDLGSITLPDIPHCIEIRNFISKSLEELRIIDMSLQECEHLERDTGMMNDNTRAST